MKILIVYSHPNPESFNHAILENLVSSIHHSEHQIDIVDLYADGFDPILKNNDFIQFRENNIPLDVAEQQSRVLDADLLIFVHPIWWGGFPAMLKGYFDRVFSIGFAYTMGEYGPEGLLTSKRVQVIRTTALSEEAYMKSGVENLIRTLLEYKFIVVCGVSDLQHHVFYEVPSVSAEVRKEYLNQVQEIGEKI
ncbi:MAG: NAD(P)H-dependent oxidoreductase [Candidatus Hodarchaeales archaeon]